jgi:hypothetical protein
MLYVLVDSIQLWEINVFRALNFNDMQTYDKCIRAFELHVLDWDILYGVGKLREFPTK